MSSCAQVQELISRMLDETLTPQEAALVERHRKSCPDCAAMYAAFHSLSSALGEELEEPPEALRENVMAELHRDAIREKNRRRLPWRAALTAAACLLLFVGLTRFVNPRLSRKDVAANSAPQSVITADYGAVVTANEAAAAGAAEEEFILADEAPVERSTMAMAAPEAVDALMDSASEKELDLPVIDLTDRMTMEALLTLLEGESITPTPDLEEPACRLLLTDGTLTLYRHDGGLYYTAPDGDRVLRCGWDEAALLARLTT